MWPVNYKYGMLPEAANLQCDLISFMSAILLILNAVILIKRGNSTTTLKNKCIVLNMFSYLKLKSYL